MTLSALSASAPFGLHVPSVRPISLYDWDPMQRCYITKYQMTSTKNELANMASSIRGKGELVGGYSLTKSLRRRGCWQLQKESFKCRGSPSPQGYLDRVRPGFRESIRTQPSPLQHKSHNMFSKIFGRDQKQQADMSPLPEEFDIIVCGGGSCGCVVAGRYVISLYSSMRKRVLLICSFCIV